MAAAGLLIGRAWKARETGGGWPDRWMDGSKGLGWLGAENQEGGRATRMDRARSRGRVDEVEKLVGGGARRIGWIGQARARVRLILYSR